jgi:hypothetical protein
MCQRARAVQQIELTQEVSPMTTHDQIPPTEALADSERTQSLSDWIRCGGRLIATWVDTCADYYAAAAMYEQLSVLSDAELTRRGLSRASLAHDVRAACERGSAT